MTQRHHQATHYPACLRRHSTPGSYYNIVIPTYKQYQGVIQIKLSTQIFMFIIGKDYYLFAISFKSYPFRNCFPFSYLYYKFSSSNNFWAFEPHLHVCIIAHHQRIRCKSSENHDIYHVCNCFENFDFFQFFEEC